MQVGLSSAAAPDASLDELLEACVRRGLAALELREGDAHRTGARDGIGGAAARERAREAGIALSGIRSDQPGADLRLARLAAAAEAPVLVAGGGMPARIERAVGLGSAGAHPVLVLDAAADDRDLEAAMVAGFDLAWDADPGAVDVGRAITRVLRRAGRRLRHVRLVGGGPEAAMQEGRGVGALMATLALAAFDGTVVLAPSSTRYRVAWQTWLGRRGGWGCGSRHPDPSLVSLTGAIAEPGGTQ